MIKGTTNKGLFITGAYGVGKTYLASCIANEIIKNGKSVIFGTLIQLLDFIRDSYSDSEVSDKDYLNLYSSYTSTKQSCFLHCSQTADIFSLQLFCCHSE